MSRFVRDYVDTALSGLRTRVSRLEGLNRAEVADGLEPQTLAVLAAQPAERLYQGRIALCSNCRKTGEGGGAGTGLPVWFDSSGATWRNFFDNAAATA
jgi:hypothetical protein